jgi:hypothetical protein
MASRFRLDDVVVLHDMPSREVYTLPDVVVVPMPSRRSTA